MADTNERTPLLKVEHLSKEFPAESGMFAKRFSKRVVSAVNDISFEIYPGDLWSGWRVWLRQVHDGPHHHASDQADRR